jgi:HEAT repeat protein
MRYSENKQYLISVCGMADKQLYADAIEQLGMLQDELANATLIKLVRHAQQGPERYLATEALARIAVQSGFKDANVMMVLEQLATDRNQDVRRSASQVVEQMRQAEVQ